MHPVQEPNPPRPFGRIPARALHAAVLLAALAALSVIAWRAWNRPSRPVLVLLIDADTPSPLSQDGPPPALDHTARAVVTFLHDVLEYEAGCAVSRSPDHPADASWKGLGRDGWVVRIQSRREGHRLRLLLDVARASDLGSGAPWRHEDSGPMDPVPATQWLIRQLGLKRRIPRGATFLPETPEVFWDLVEAQALQRADGDLERATRLAESCEARAPKAAAPHVLLGTLHIRRLALDRQLWHRDHGLQHLLAAQRLLPGLPRAVLGYVRLRSDTGGARECLGIVLSARRDLPHSLTLLSALAYTARYAGLLELAEKASLKQNERVLHPHLSFRHLLPLRYSGRWEEHRRSLWTTPGDFANPSTCFFRGFLDLLERKPDEACRSFAEGETVPGTPDYQRMCKAFRLILQGKPGEAKEVLEELRAYRIGLMVPDGEFTLELAQGFALAGDRVRATELAQQAFIEGFGCTSWFERSPFLESVRATPQWNFLHQKLQERQLLVESAFPRSSWGL